MSLPVTYFASYLTTTAVDWRDEDYCASMFIKAIKGKEFKGYANMTVRDNHVRLESKNAADAKRWFAQMAADQLQALKMNAKVRWGLIPFPSSTAVLDQKPAAYASLDLAEFLADELGSAGFKKVSVLDVIRWTEKRPSAHQEGGARNPDQVFRYLALTTAKKATVDFCLLIDDVLTSGARMRSAAALCRGRFDVWKGLVAGRTVSMQPADPFKVTTEELSDYFPTMATAP